MNKKLNNKNLPYTGLPFLFKEYTLYICVVAKPAPIVTPITDPAHHPIVLCFVLFITKLTNKLSTFLDFHTSYLGSLPQQIATDSGNTTMAYQKK